MPRVRWIIVVLTLVAAGGAWWLLSAKDKPKPRSAENTEEPDPSDPEPANTPPPRPSPRRAVPRPSAPAARATAPAPEQPADPADPKAPATKGPPKIPPEVLARNKKLKEAAEKKQHALLEHSVKVAKERVEKLTRDLPRMRRDPNVSAAQVRQIERQIAQYQQAAQRIERQLQEKK